MKIAIVQDELVRRGGAEQVVLSMHKAYPQAPIYTLCYNPDKTYPEFKQARIITSWFQKIGKSDKLVKMLFFPFAMWAMRALDLSAYDVVLVSTTHCGKYIRVKENTKLITYCHTPFRLAWRPESYENVINKNIFTKWALLLASKLFRKTDLAASKRTDWYITNAKEVKERIETTYHPRNKVTVINPSVKTENFYVSEDVKEYYLVVCRLEPYKKVDVVIDAFNQMPERQLIVVGKGSMEKELYKKAGANIQFLHSLDARQLAKIFADAQALIFPQHEDYGITPLEAAASGRPVIAYKEGGVNDTMIPYKGNALRSTALFFDTQTPHAIVNAVIQFEQLSFDPYFIKQHAESFGEVHFIEQLKTFVAKVTQTQKAKALCTI
ncbi:MAG: glycosyltransferase [Filimonas sp.]|nr:glycosyltransferase [Filimonas sp.]